MPCTRSQKQPTLQFPKRKSSKVMTRPKSSYHPASENIPELQAIPLSPRKLTVTAIRAEALSPRKMANVQTFPLSPLKAGVSNPLSPLKSRCAVGTIPLSPLKHYGAVGTFPLSPLKSDVFAPLSPLKSSRLPLSPRKRVGDENGCNLPSSLTGSPPKLSRTSLGSPRKLVFGENAPVVTSPPQSRSANPRPDSLQKKHNKSPVSRCEDQSITSAPDAEPKSQFQCVKQVLHTAIPERLLTRETERAAILSFLNNHVVPGRPSSLYISGAPGTGKTACLNCVLQEQKALLASVQTVVINCMTLRSSHSIFPLLTEKLGRSKNHNGKLEKLMTSSGPTVLLVLDEMDQLDSKAQDVLYTIFEWPYLPKSRLCLIGIANALDLTDRILPRLQARPHCRPKLLHFPPYSHQELVAIVQDRLLQVSGGGVLDAMAVQFCARKVSAVSGDARKALDICRRAVEMVESSSKSRGASEMPSNLSAGRVSVPQVARVLSEVYGDRMASSAGAEGESFPLQQKLLVCCLLLITRSGKSKDVQLGKLCEVYSKLCQQRQVSGVGQTECLSLCSLLESRGIFSLKKAKEARLTKISLKIEEKDVENALRDRTLLGSILAAGLP